MKSSTRGHRLWDIGTEARAICSRAAQAGHFQDIERTSAANPKAYRRLMLARMNELLCEEYPQFVWRFKFGHAFAGFRQVNVWPALRPHWRRWAKKHGFNPHTGQRVRR